MPSLRVKPQKARGRIARLRQKSKPTKPRGLAAWVRSRRPPVAKTEPKPTLAAYNQLRDNIAEAAKHARNQMFALLFINVYGLLTLATIKDADFYERGKGVIKLPFVGLDMPLIWYLPGIAMFSSITFMYFHFYLQHAWKLVHQAKKAGEAHRFHADYVPTDSLYRYPWIAFAIDQPGNWNRLGTFFFGIVQWCLTPALLTACVMRTIRLQSELTLHHWVRLELPSHHPFAFLTLLSMLAAVFLWRRSRRLYRLPLNRKTYLFPALGITVVATGIVISGHEHRLQLAAAQLQRSNLSLVSLRGALLRSAQLNDADLSGAQLKGADLSGAQLHSANLSDAQLKGADLRNAQLNGANLWRAQLNSADLSDAQLNDANLIAAQLNAARLRGTQLNGADLHAAQLNAAKLWRAQLEGAYLSDAQLNGAYLRDAQLNDVDLSDAQLNDVDLSDAQLNDVDLSDAQLNGALLRSAQLNDADLNRAQLNGADLSGAQLNGASLWRAQLEGAYLSDAQLNGAYLSDAQLNGADLSDAQLNDANLRGTQLNGADLSDAQLNDANLRGTQLNGANLWRAQLEGANLWRAQLDGACAIDPRFIFPYGPACPATSDSEEPPE